ncbi:GntR family transcriptional regulator [Micromonospora chalcea]|uniref:GntR family transcriptional regulator n=1 Tax=Micromonospora chalcea TaxID=1874 RepID=UPI00068AE41F|nr:GntR family transcriptional regulator [Micromonospora chalcea]MCT2278477.1 GntR family transcriptional regulator [Micromonospora chalcea]
MNIQPAQPGRLHEQNKLPSTAQLKAEHGVSTTVVRQAILVLQTQGWVEGVHGLGVFVADRSESR